jgi:hypothetical protein
MFDPSFYAACGIIVVQCILDGQQLEEKVYPPPTMDGFFKGLFFY